MEMSGIFHFLSFREATPRAIKVEKMNFIVSSTIRFVYRVSWKIICEKWTVCVAFYDNFLEIIGLHVTFLTE